MEQFELEWNEVSLKEPNSIFFSYKNGKFRDMDFHPVETTVQWKAMMSSSVKEVALVEIDSLLSMKELKKCAQTLRARGAYKKIRFVVKSTAR